MARQQGYGELPSIVHDHHRRIAILPLKVWGDDPDHDSGGHDKDKAVHFMPEATDQVLQLSVERDRPFPGLARIFPQDMESGIGESTP
jgi:hypothetical protein